MTLPLGTVPANSTLYIPFATYGGTDGESITCSGLALTDIEVYKNGSTTQRASDSGYALLDTDGIDFDGITGIHGFSVDLSDNDDAGFYAVGSFYWVVVSSITVDAQTVNFVAATFRIGPAESVTGHQPVDAAALGGAVQSAIDLQDFADAGYDPETHKVGGVVLTDTCTTNTDMRGTDGAALASAYTATRGGYLDKLNVAGTLAHSGAAATYKADVSALATAADLAILASYVDTEVAQIITILQGDWIISDPGEGAAYQITVYEAGTANVVVAAKDLRQLDETDVTSASHVVAAAVEPAA